MTERLFILCFLLLFGGAVFGQCPISNFTIPPTGCSEESIYPNNLSLNSSDYFWDYCSGDLQLTPIEERIATSSLIYRGRSIRISKVDSTGWVGFAIDQVGNRLVRFDFGNDLQNPPTLTNLGNPGNLLAGAYDFALINVSGNWFMLVVNSSNNNLVKLSFGNDIFSSNPIVENLGDFGQLDVPNGIKIQEESGSFYVFVTNGGDNSITRLLFDTSFLNTPLVNTFPITGINNPRGIDIIKDCERWIGMVSSYSNNKIFYLDFQNGLDQLPNTGEITFYTLFNFPASLSIVFEGGQYYTMIQSALGNLYKLSFGVSIADLMGSGQNLGNFGLASNFALDWVSDNSDWYGFSIELNNPETPGQGNLIRYTFPTVCSASPATSTLEYPDFSYGTSGANQVTLIAHDAAGNNNATNQSITISPSQAPQIQASSTGNCLYTPINFLGQELSGDITNWNWDFGDGVGTSMLQDPSYSYGAAGDYQVRLNVTDANGCNNLLIDTVSVYDEPIPNFTAPGSTLCMNNPVQFTNTTTGETGPAVSWTWDFNGEGSSSLKDPEFTFLSSGNKTITLTSSIPGCANVVQQNIYIEVAPTTDFSFDNVCNTNATTFVDQSVGTGLISWNWDFGDGFNSTDQNPTHTYAIPGQYEVVLTVANNLGCSTSSTQTVFNHAIPTPAFQYDLPCSGTDVQFTDQSLVQDANLVAWEWDFGNPASSSNSSTLQNPMHVYAAPGDYVVTLKAYSQFGCVDSLSKTISVIQGPDVQFTWDQACVGEPTTFIDQTITNGIPVNERIWIIDGTPFTEQSPEYMFSTPGTYTVSLGITLNNLCANILEQDIIINSALVPDFGYLEACNDDQVSLFDLTSYSAINPVASREWRIDGQLQPETDSVFTTNLNPGLHEVVLTVISGGGCEENTTKAPINIIGAPVADFSMSHDYGASPLPVQFTNNSTGALNYTWFFGDAKNSTSTEANPTFSYTEEGLHEVRLIAASSEDCADTSLVQVVEVVPAVVQVLLADITPIYSEFTTQFSLSIENPGTVLLDDNLELVFQLDNGAEVVEPFSKQIFAGESILYIPDYTIGNALDARSLCITLRVRGEENEILGEDKDCLNLDELAVITTVFPNPTTDYFNIDVVIPAVEAIELSIIDESGHLIFNNTYANVKIGLNEFSIDARVYRAGMYIIQVKYQGLVKEMKAVVSK